MAGTLADLFVNVPAETVVIDTSNHYPHLNGRIEAVGDGCKVENVYTSELLGRPVVKAWNAALAETQRTRGGLAGLRAASPSRWPATPRRRRRWP
ncbi:hypothetical protein OG800_01245 [Streptomyces sp. NBC_00445]|uniref:hypothetical protein n=1 Tax=unclassified Streptomyces TaxID=2593676 RepID=UPI002E1E8A92|nr:MULTISPECIES: hypothetical protein [unclassified Streptomyces]